MPVTSQDGTTWRTLASVDGTTLPGGQRGRLLPRLGRRPRAHAPPLLLRLLRRRRAADAAAGRRRRRRRRRADPALGPRHRRQRPARQRRPAASTASRTPRSSRRSSRSSWARSRAGDTRVFTLPPVRRRRQRQRALAGAARPSPRSSGSAPTRRRRALAAAGFALGKVERDGRSHGVAPGTVVGPTELRGRRRRLLDRRRRLRGLAADAVRLPHRQRQGGQGQRRQAPRRSRSASTRRGPRPAPRRWRPPAAGACTRGASRSRRAPRSRSCACRRRCAGRATTASSGVARSGSASAQEGGPDPLRRARLWSSSARGRIASRSCWPSTRPGVRTRISSSADRVGLPCARRSGRSRC